MGIHGITGNHDIANVSTFILMLPYLLCGSTSSLFIQSFVSELGTLHRSLIRERLSFPFEGGFSVL